MKKPNFKPVLVVILIIAMAFSMVSCKPAENGDDGGNAGDIPTITYMLPSDPGFTFTADTWQMQNWAKKTNVKIEIQSPARDSFSTKIAALFASGQLPDLVNYYQDQATKFYKQYGSQFFVPLDSYLESGKLDGLKRWLDKYPDIRELMDHPVDGKLYGFPMVYDLDAYDSAFTIRNDVLKQGGMDASEIKTLDDFKKALTTLKTVSNSKYIASSRLGWNYFALYLGKFMGTGPEMMYDNRTPAGTNKYVFAPAYPQYKEFIEFCNWMYKNEILHPNFATMEQQELSAGYAEGKFLVCMEQVTMGMQLGGNQPEKYPGREEKVIFPVAINGVVPKQNNFLHQNNGFRWPVTVSKTSKNIDACMRMMGWIYTDEGIYQNIFGEEGVHWVKDDTYFYGARTTEKRQGYATGKMKDEGKLTQAEYDALPNAQALGMVGSYWINPVIQEENRYGLMDKPKSLVEEKPYITFIRDNVQYGIDNGYTTGVVDPIISHTKEELDQMASIKQTLDTYTSETSMKMITGAFPLSDYDKFLAELDKLGYKKIEDMYNAKLK